MRSKLDFGLPLLYVIALIVAGVFFNATALGGTAVIGAVILIAYYLTLRPKK